MRYIFLGALAWLLWTSTASAQTLRDEPWEPVPRAVRRASAPSARAPRDTYRPIASAAMAAIAMYRSSTGTRPMRRCPYAVSCSNYAMLVLHRHGFAGIFWFIDRFYFRENHAAHHHYPLVRMRGGEVRLDDGAPHLE